MERLDILEYSLSQFCNEARELLESLEDREAFIKFVLNGVDDGYQIVLNPLLDRPTLPDLKAVRDYDSLLGISRHILVNSDLTLNVLGRLDHVLTSNVHITYSWGHETAPVHKIPNICIGKWTDHSMLRILIPGLYDREVGARMSPEQLQKFYNLGYYPAVRSLMGIRAADWPATYQAEVFRAQNSKGRITVQTKMFPEHLVPRLGDAIREQLLSNDVQWGASVVFLHQIRGVKNTTSHQFDEVVIQYAFKNFLDANGLIYNDLVEGGEFFIDVGVEVSSRMGECLAWRTDSHRHVIGRILDVTEHQANKITSIGSSKYVRDITSHMPQVSGCRVSPGSQSEGPMKARYVQLYQTDKSVTAHKENFHHGKFIDGAAILNGKGVDYIFELYSLYVSSCSTVQSHARAEVRVPIQEYPEAFSNFCFRLMERSLITVPRNVWWGLRAFRALAYQHLVHEMEAAPAIYRARRNSLLLMASAPWFLNSLHCTPDLGQSSRDLLINILPHIRKEDATAEILPFPMSIRRDGDDGSSDESVASSDDDLHPVHVARTGDTVPAILHGLLFLRPFELGEGIQCPKFIGGKAMFISAKTFKYIFGKPYQDIQTFLVGGDMVQRANPNRVRNKIRRTLRYVPEENEPRIFNLGNRGLYLNTFSDPEDESDNEVQEIAEALDMNIPDVDMQLSQLWRQFFLDITQKAPNMSRAGRLSYVKLTAEEQQNVNEDTHKNHILSDYFRVCQWKIPDEDGWDTIFGHFWPDKGVVKHNAQNYGQCSYYRSWGLFLQRCPNAHTIRVVRREIRKRFDKLFWVPYAYCDKMWWTKKSGDQDKGKFTCTTVPSQAAPRIAVRNVPTWNEED